MGDMLTVRVWLHRVRFAAADFEDLDHKYMTRMHDAMFFYSSMNCTMAMSMQAYVSSHSMMTDCGPIHCRLHIPQFTPDTTEVQGRQGPFSSCHNQMHYLIQLLNATICRKCKSRNINDSDISPDDHLIVQQCSIFS
jgi:hypothetical protein